MLPSLPVMAAGKPGRPRRDESLDEHRRPATLTSWQETAPR